MPINLRVQKQAFGRTARWGRNGTAQLILNYATELGIDEAIVNEIDKLQNSNEVNLKVRAQIEDYCKTHGIPNSIEGLEKIRDENY